MNSDTKPVDWAFISPKEQSHQQCRYCQNRGEWMRKQGKQSWVLLCTKHAIHSLFHTSSTLMFVTRNKQVAKAVYGCSLAEAKELANKLGLKLRHDGYDTKP